MKYRPPPQGQYESGLTAGLMCSIADSLIKAHITPEDAKRTDEKYGKPSPENLWEKPEIRSELEEFVNSYLFDGLQTPISGFGEVFKGNLQAKKEHLEDYTSALEQHYCSRSEASSKISELFKELKKRGNRLYREIHEINNLEGERPSMNNASEAFGQIAFSIYGNVEQIIDL